MQAPIQRSQEISRGAENDARRPDILQQQFADRMQKDASKAQMQVRGKDKGEKGVVDKDGKRESEDSRKKRNEKEKKQAALAELIEERRLLDVKI
jgi:hypothetical protein